jgi:hypothetical protein
MVERLHQDPSRAGECLRARIIIMIIIMIMIKIIMIIYYYKTCLQGLLGSLYKQFAFVQFAFGAFVWLLFAFISLFLRLFRPFAFDSLFEILKSGGHALRNIPSHRLPIGHTFGIFPVTGFRLVTRCRLKSCYSQSGSRKS